METLFRELSRYFHLNPKVARVRIPAFSLMLAVSLLGLAALLPLGYAVLPGHSLPQPKLTPIQEKMSLHTSSSLTAPFLSLSFLLPSSRFYSSAPTPGFSPHRHPSSPCFAARSPIFSLFSPPLPFSLWGADQFTASLGSVRASPALTRLPSAILTPPLWEAQLANAWHPTPLPRPTLHSWIFAGERS